MIWLKYKNSSRWYGLYPIKFREITNCYAIIIMMCLAEME